MDDRSRHNLLWGLFLFFAVALLCFFFAALLENKLSAVADALGGFIGGLIGAAGAIVAVFLTLDRQRKHEADKVADAVRAEVIALTKFVVGALGKCEDVVKGRKSIPQSDARYIVNTLMSPPVVYPATADRIALISHAQPTIEFYMRINEAKALADVLAAARATPGCLVTAEQVRPIADSLLVALVCARTIVDEPERIPPRSAVTSNIVRQRTVGSIRECLKSAEKWFPEAVALQHPRAF